MDVHQFFICMPAVLSRTSISFNSVILWSSISSHTDIHKNHYGRPSAFLRTSISTSVDVHQFFICMPAVLSRTSISFFTDINQYLCGRPSVFMCMPSSDILDVYQLSYRRPSVPLLTSISFYMNTRQCHLERLVLIGSSLKPLRTSIRFHTDVYRYLCGHPSHNLWGFHVEIHHLSYGRQ